MGDTSSRFKPLGVATCAVCQGCHRLIDPALHRAGSRSLFQILGRRKLDPRSAGPVIYSAWFTHRHESWLRMNIYTHTHIYLMIYIYIHIWWIKTNQVQWPLCIVLHFIFGVVIRLPANLQDKFECKHMQTWWCCSGGWKGTSWRQWIAMDRICFF